MPTARKARMMADAMDRGAGAAVFENALESHPWEGRRNVLDLDDFARAEIEAVFETADRMKEVLARPIPRVPALRGRSIVNLFYEASTRTRVSFEAAAKSLGADVTNVTATGSSVEKGETLLDTVRTLQALGATALVVRHPHSGAPYTVARHTGLPVINAGDGTHAHPTQALLDAYTMREQFGRVHGLRVLIVGDIAHSRVARSDAWCLTTLGAEVTLSGPPTLLPPTCTSSQALTPTLSQRDRGQPSADRASLAPAWPVQVDFDLDHAICSADVVMPLRVQLERQEGNRLSSLREYARDYGITSLRMAQAPSRAVVMHPGPMNEGVEIDADVAHGPRSMVQAQVAHGVAIRMAVLYLLIAATSRARDGAHIPLSAAARPTTQSILV